MAKLKGSGKTKAKSPSGKVKRKAKAKTGSKSKTRTGVKPVAAPYLPARTEAGQDGNLAKVVLLVVLLAGLGVGVYFFVREYFTVSSVGDVEQTPSPLPEGPAVPPPPSGDQTDTPPVPTEGDESLAKRFEKWVGENKNWFYPVGGLVVIGIPLAYVLYLLYERFFGSAAPELYGDEKLLSRANSSLNLDDHRSINSLGAKGAKRFLSDVQRSSRKRLLKLRQKGVNDLHEAAELYGESSDAVTKAAGKLKILDIMLSGNEGSKEALRTHVGNL